PVRSLRCPPKLLSEGGRRPRRPNRKRRYGMAMPTFTMRQLLEAGVHFGHHTRRWNPKMKPYLFGVRNGVHIIDLTKTVPLLEQALQQARQAVSNGGGRAPRCCQMGGACCSWAPRQLPPSVSRRPPSAAASTTSTTAGWAA